MIKEALKIWWNQWTWPLKLGTLVAIGVLLLIVVFTLKSCFKSDPPKIDELEIQKGEQAVKERNDKALRDILTNSDVKEAQIIANVSNARAETVNAMQEAKEKYGNMNTDELAAELEKRK